jgi:hypothetical protein
VYPAQGNSAGIQQIRHWLHTAEPRVWMFLGDETTAWMRYRGEPGYVEMFRHRLRWELRRHADLIVNAGIERAAIVDLQKVARQGLQQCRASAVFVMPGRSDLKQVMEQPARYAEQLRLLAGQIRSEQAEIILQTPPWPIDSGEAPEQQAAALLVDLIREVCVVQGIPLIDHAGFWQDQASQFDWFNSREQLPTSAGQAALALQFLAELELYDPSSPFCLRLQNDCEKAGENQSYSDHTGAVAVSSHDTTDGIS